MYLQKEIEALYDYISKGKGYNKVVSEKDTFWHIDHSMRVIMGVVNLLNSPKEVELKKRFNWRRVYLFTLGSIPRKKMKAPRVVTSEEDVTIDMLEKRKKNVRFALKQLDKAPNEAYFNHIYVGKLNKRQAVRFLEIHTNHHLKIIGDILK